MGWVSLNSDVSADNGKSYTAGYYLTYKAVGYIGIDLCSLQLSLLYPQMCNDCTVYEPWHLLKYGNANCYGLLLLARDAGMLY